MVACRQAESKGGHVYRQQEGGLQEIDGVRRLVSGKVRGNFPFTFFYGVV